MHIGAISQCEAWLYLHIIRPRHSTTNACQFESSKILQPAGTFNAQIHVDKDVSVIKTDKKSGMIPKNQASFTCCRQKNSYFKIIVNAPGSYLTHLGPMRTTTNCVRRCRSAASTGRRPPCRRPPVAGLATSFVGSHRCQCVRSAMP